MYLNLRILKQFLRTKRQIQGNQSTKKQFLRIQNVRYKKTKCQDFIDKISGSRSKILGLNILRALDNISGFKNKITGYVNNFGD